MCLVFLPSLCLFLSLSWSAGSNVPSPLERQACFLQVQLEHVGAASTGSHRPPLGFGAVRKHAGTLGPLRHQARVLHCLGL